MDRPNRNRGADDPGKARLDKGGRLAEALRENLRKRKAQARSRRSGAGGGEDRPANDTKTGENR